MVTLEYTDMILLKLVNIVYSQDGILYRCIIVIYAIHSQIIRKQVTITSWTILSYTRPLLSV